MLKKMKWARQSALSAVGVALAAFHGSVFASGTPIDGAGDETQEGLGEIARILAGWLSGDLGLLIVVVGIIVAVIMIVARASLGPILFVLGLAIVLGWGPGIAQSILSAEIQGETIVSISNEGNAPPRWMEDPAPGLAEVER